MRKASQRFILPTSIVAILAALVLVQFSVALPAQAESEVRAPLAAYDEGVDGDLSNTPATPTTFNLATGSNALNGSTVSGDPDLVHVNVPANTELSQLNLTAYSGASQSFIGMQNGATWTEGVGNSITAANLDGYVLIAPGMVSTDILADIGSGAGTVGFTPPLPAGDYTFLFQETSGTSVDYAVDFVVGAVASPLVAIGFEDFDGGALNLSSTANVFDFDAGGGTGGDVFGRVSGLLGGTGMPFDLGDDTVVDVSGARAGAPFPTDSRGIAGQHTTAFFGLNDADAINSGALNNATWTFSGWSSTTLGDIAIDMAAMGDFESSSSDGFKIEAAINGSGTFMTIFEATTDDSASKTYRAMDNGDVNFENDPLQLFIDGSATTVGFLDKNDPATGAFDTYTSTLLTGETVSQVDIRISWAGSPSGGEAMGIDNITIYSSEPGSAEFHVTESFAGISGEDGTAEWFEITNQGTIAGDTATLYYEDNSDNPENAVQLPSIILNPGEAAVFLNTNNASEIAVFQSVWGNITNIANMGGPGMNDAGDDINLYDGNTAGATLVESVTYTMSHNTDLATFEYATDGTATFSMVGVNNAYRSNEFFNDNLSDPDDMISLVGSPANFTPPAIQISASKSVVPDVDVAENGVVTYTLVIASNGAASTAFVTDTLPSETDFAYWVEQPSGAAESSDEITWSGIVSSTQPVTLTFAVTNTASSGTVMNTVNYDGSTSGSADATYTVAIPPAPPVTGLSCFTESFEAVPGDTYNLSAVFDDGGFDYFNRYAVPDNNNFGRDDFQDGWDGSFGIQGQDHDGDGNAATQSVTIAGIDVSSATAGIKVQMALGALNSDQFQNYEPGDGFKIYATLDSGARTLIGEFAPPAGNGNLMQDTDSDGVGDGTTLTVALADFTFDVGATGNNLTIEIEMTSNDSFEPLALDHVRVLCAAPEHVLINEVDSDTAGTDTLEFVELYDGGFGNVPLDGLVVVGYNGSDDAGTGLAVDLDGQTTNADGYFVIGNADVENVDIVVASNSIQNGADAIALYVGDAASFPNDATLTTVGLLDALVYDTSDSDDAGLAVLLNPGQPQIDENGQGDKDNHSNQRCPNGEGGARNTTTYGQYTPTPGTSNCFVPPALGFTRIYTIQGNTDASPHVGAQATTTGVVVADFQDDGLDGFNIQDLTGDGDTATSDGIFVFEGDASVTVPDLNVGDIVTVTAQIVEFSGLTELGAISSIVVSGTGTISPTKITLPLDETQREALEGMLVEVDERLYVTEIFELGRYGQVMLSADDRAYQFTHNNAPDPTAYAAHQTAFDNNTIKLDDKEFDQNPDPVIYPAPGLSAANPLRGGSTVDQLRGVMHFVAGQYMLEPVEEVTFAPANPREAAPPKQPGTLSVATMNVLNFFTTLDDEAGAVCGPTGGLDCRGAESASEFERQRNKILAALMEMDADVVGLVELQNSTDNAALQSLIDGLNGATRAGTYAYIATGAIGTDAIAVGFIYKTDIVEPVGAHAILDSSVDPNFIDTKNRPALAQTFMEKATGEKFTAVVNHFKSKGSACDDVGDPGLDDGAGNCNLTRQKAAQAVADWLSTDPTSSGDPDYLILGDLNAYRNETPITALEAAGYTDLAEAFVGDKAYSFVFGGEWGYLDYALSNASLTPQVVRADEWHINADEPVILDYNENFQSAGQIDLFYAPDAYRSSDHDPMVVTLRLGGDRLHISKSAEPASDVMPGDLVTYTIVLTSTGGVESVAITDTLPAEVDFAHWVVQPMDAGVANDVITVTGDVSSSQPLTITFAVTNTAASGMVTNTVLFGNAFESGSAQASYAAVAAPPPQIIPRLYLPVVMSNYVVAPDLVVERIDASGSELMVTIKNVGNAVSSADFWVDLIVNPSTAPTMVNDTVESLGATGVVWGVSNVTLAPDETLVLMIDDAYVDSVLTNFAATFNSGDKLYAHVDSANSATTFGAVNESHEIMGYTYNNITMVMVP